jgi:hypothetical protein
VFAAAARRENIPTAQTINSAEKPMASHLLQFLYSILFGAIGFGLARFLKIEVRSSVWIGAMVAIAAFTSSALDFIKKAQEIRKLELEIAALKREAKEAKSLVRIATSEERRKFGVTITERKLEKNRRISAQKDRLVPKDLIDRLD